MESNSNELPPQAPAGELDSAGCAAVPGSGHAELRAMKERMVNVFERLEESQESHQKHRDAATDEVTKMCHAGAADAYLNAKRRIQKAIWGDTEF